MTIKKWLGAISIGLASALILGACSSDDAKNQVTVGVMTMTESDEARWGAIEEELKKAGKDIDLEFVQFTNYTQPNQALVDGDVDINAFQHHAYLEEWNGKTKNDVVAILDTYLSPIRLYSGTEGGKNKYTSVEDIPEGGRVIIPDDPSNLSRSLYVLQAAGLIELGVSDGKQASRADITANPKNLKIDEIAADKLPSFLQDADAAVINNSYAVPAKLDTAKALFVEEKDENSEQWINIIAANKDWKDQEKAEAIQAILDAYHTDSVKKAIDDTSDGLDLPVW